MTCSIRLDMFDLCSGSESEVGAIVTKRNNETGTDSGSNSGKSKRLRDLQCLSHMMESAHERATVAAEGTIYNGRNCG